MTPAPSAGRRLPVLGCLLVAVAALAGCGSDGDASAENAPVKTPGRQPQAIASHDPCPARVKTFTDSLDVLRKQLALGLSYEQYAAKVKVLHRDYEEIPVEQLTLDCLTIAGTAAESAFNKYIDAANAWGECLANASCTTATIEPVLQRKWRLASQKLSAVE